MLRKNEIRFRLLVCIGNPQLVSLFKMDDYRFALDEEGGSAQIVYELCVYALADTRAPSFVNFQNAADPICHTFGCRPAAPSYIGAEDTYTTGFRLRGSKLSFDHFFMCARNGARFGLLLGFSRKGASENENDKLKLKSSKP